MGLYTGRHGQSQAYLASFGRQQPVSFSQPSQQVALQQGSQQGQLKPFMSLHSSSYSQQLQLGSQSQLLGAVGGCSVGAGSSKPFGQVQQPRAPPAAAARTLLGLAGATTQGNAQMAFRGMHQATRPALPMGTPPGSEPMYTSQSSQQDELLMNGSQTQLVMSQSMPVMQHASQAVQPSMGLGLGMGAVGAAVAPNASQSLQQRTTLLAAGPSGAAGAAPTSSYSARPGSMAAHARPAASTMSAEDQRGQGQAQQVALTAGAGPIVMTSQAQRPQLSLGKALALDLEGKKALEAVDGLQVRVADLENGQGGLADQVATHTAHLHQMFTTLTDLSKTVEGVADIVHGIRGMLQADIDARCEAAAAMAEQQAQAAAGRHLLVLRDAMVQTSPPASAPRSADGGQRGTFRRKSLIVRHSLMVEEEYEEVHQGAAGSSPVAQRCHQTQEHGRRQHHHGAAFCGVELRVGDEVNSGNRGPSVVVEDVTDRPTPTAQRGINRLPSSQPQAKTFSKRPLTANTSAHVSAAAQPAAKKQRASGVLARLSGKAPGSSAVAPGPNSTTAGRMVPPALPVPSPAAKPFSDLLAGAGNTAGSRKPLLQLGRASSGALPIQTRAVPPLPAARSTWAPSTAAPHQPSAAREMHEIGEARGGAEYTVDDEDLAQEVAARMSRHRSRRMRNRL